MDKTIVTLTTLPAANQSYANKVFRLLVEGADDKFYIVQRQAAGTYTWFQIAPNFVTGISDTASIDLTMTGTVLSAAAIFGTTATTVAVGNHTHSIYINAVTDTASIDMTLAGQSLSAVAIFAGTGSAGTVAHSDHTHTATGAQTVADTASIDLTLAGTVLSADAIFGTTATTIAAGNHTHSTYVNAVTDTASIDLTLAGQSISAAAIFGTTATTVAAGNHTHTTTYAPIGAKYIVQTADADLTAEQSLAALGTGIVKNTTATGVLSIAVDGTDYSSPGHTHPATDLTTVKYVVTYGPYFINDLPGTATTQAKLAMFDTATTVLMTTREIQSGRLGEIIGLSIVSDAPRTAGTATVRILLSGVDTAFDGGSVVLDATFTAQKSGFVAAGAGVAISSSSARIGVNVTTSGWTPITANVAVWVHVMYNAI